MDNKGEKFNGMGFGSASMLHPAFRMPTRQEKRAPGERNTALRAEFLKEINSAIQKCDKSVTSELSTWLKVNSAARPGAILEKLDSQQAYHAKMGSGWGGSNESKAFSEALLKLIKDNQHALFMMADIEIEEWSALANELSSQLTALQGHDTKSITEKLDNANAQVLQLTRDATAAKVELEKKQAEIERIQDALKKVEAEKVASQDDMEKIRETNKEVELENASLRSQLQVSQTLGSRLETDKSEMKAENSVLKGRLEEEAKLSATKDIELAKLRAEAEGYKQRLEDANARIKHLEGQVSANAENQKEFAANQKELVIELKATRQDLNSSRAQLETSMSQSFSGKKGGNGGYAVPATPAPRDAQPPHNTSAALSRNSRGVQLAASTPQTQPAFFQAAVVPQAVPAPNLLTLEVVCLPVSKTETTNQANILKYIDYIRSKNVISDTRLKAFIAIARFLNAVPTITDQDPVYKFAIESAKQLATHDTGSPNNPIECLNAILGHSTAVKALTKEPSFQQLCDELTRLSKEQLRGSSAETLNASRLHGGLRNLFEKDAFNVVVLKDHFRAQKLVFEAKEKETAAPEAKSEDSADVSRNTSTLGRSGGQ